MGRAAIPAMVRGPAEAGTTYAPDDDDLGAWTKTFYFVPAADWNGSTGFGSPFADGVSG